MTPSPWMLLCLLLAGSPMASAQDAAAPPPTEAAAAEPAEAAAPAVDPAVWGPYAQLVGRSFVGETVAGWPGYGTGKRTIEWETPGKVMVETIYNSSGQETSRMRILPESGGRLLFDVAMAPNARGTITAPDTLAFDQAFGYQTTMRLTGPDSFEHVASKRGEVKGHAVYHDVNSQAVAQRDAEREAQADAERIARREALRAAGVPDTVAVEAPASQVFAYQEPVRGPAAQLRLTRGKAWELGACMLAVYINGRWAARLDENQTASFRVPAGKLQVSVGTDPMGRGTCKMGQSGQVTHETVLARGESVHVHFLGAGRFSEALLPIAME